MKLAISNIAWPHAEEERVADVLQELRIGGLEVAPTQIWPAPLTVSAAELRDYRAFWTSKGVTIVAMQSLLFGRADLTVFGSQQKQRETLEYLAGMMRVGAELGARALVFGSPKNRRVGDLDANEVRRVGLAFFREAAALAERHGVAFCIEPNPPAYDCDYLTTAAEVRDVVREVARPGLGIHLDAAGMTLTNEAIEENVGASLPWLRHFHISEPFLAPIRAGTVDHRSFAAELARCTYAHWVSIEMRTIDDGRTVERVGHVLQLARELYAALDSQPG